MIQYAEQLTTVRCAEQHGVQNSLLQYAVDHTGVLSAVLHLGQVQCVEQAAGQPMLGFDACMARAAGVDLGYQAPLAACKVFGAVCVGAVGGVIMLK